MSIDYNIEYIKELKKIDELNEEIKVKKYSPYDIINYLSDSKPAPAWKDLTEEEQKAFNPFLTYRSLSSNEYLIRVLSLMNKYDTQPGVFYEFLRSIMDNKQKWYYNYKAYKKSKIKNEDERKLAIYSIKKEYQLGNRDAEYYLENLNDDVLNTICKKWKDYYEIYGC